MPANRAAAPANVAAPAPQVAAAAFPAGFPSSDPDELAASCVVFLGLSPEAGTSTAGRDEAAMRQAQDQVRSALRRRIGATEADQLIASSVNPLAATPAEQRDAAARWCLANGPEPSPAR